ncbi:MAG: hypothetical protein ACREMZ_17690, partial [Gemmatimonadales bacterium]
TGAMTFSYAALAATCLIVGWFAGSGWTAAARAWRDYRLTKAQLPGLLQLARLLSVKAAGWVTLAIGATGFALYLLATQSGR